jgi:hypothetical protein
MSVESMARAREQALAMIAAARASPSGLVYEAYPSRQWCRESQLPLGYCGQAYRPDDQYCLDTLVEDIDGGWRLETPEEIARI